MKIYKDIYPLIHSPQNLFAAWDIFKSDKRNKADVAKFEQGVERHLFQLHRELRGKTYRHGRYYGFWINDPKLRHIHKATVRDRVLHHAIFQALNPIFEPTFIPTSYSCRVGKGTHKGVADVAEMLRTESKNDMRRCWALKCDVQKFFDSVDHNILLKILAKKIRDPDALWLMQEVVGSYATSATLFERRGVPIGNLTSQLFANVYMNEFDQFIKQELRVKNYARYTDDFIIVSDDKTYLSGLLEPLQRFLADELHLKLHPRKITLRPYTQGIDFLGYVILPHHILLRTKPRRRMYRKLHNRVAEFRGGVISEATLKGSLQSYLGVLSHADAYDLGEELRNNFWYWLKE